MNQDNIITSGHQTPFTGFIKVLRTKFVEYFGTTKHIWSHLQSAMSLIIKSM